MSVDRAKVREKLARIIRFGGFANVTDLADAIDVASDRSNWSDTCERLADALLATSLLSAAGSVVPPRPDGGKGNEGFVPVERDELRSAPEFRSAIELARYIDSLTTHRMLPPDGASISFNYDTEVQGMICEDTDISWAELRAALYAAGGAT